MKHDVKAATISFLHDKGQDGLGSIVPLLKRTGEAWPLCGFVLVDEHQVVPTVYLMNMFELCDGPIGPQIANVPKHTYETIEALAEDGWEVD